MEYRIFGPPGTGKTTYLANQITAAAEKHGAENILVASFTRTAATELNTRKLPIPRENIGTLHALCYRALNSPEIAELHIKEFNDENPSFKLSPQKAGKLDEMAVDTTMETQADRFMSQYNLHRARMLSLETLPTDCKAFMKRWESWKLKNKYIDFTDMIAFTLLFRDPPPGGATIGVYDEVQDFNKLELSVIRMWAEQQEFILLAGDDDQSLYEFTGASPDAFLFPEIPQEQKRILSQSWRLPKKVQEISLRWISQVKHREPKDFKARDVEGEVLRMGATTYKKPERLIEKAADYADKGKTVMILTSCGYMLNTIKTKLREQGLPFHNPYRRTRGDWNPLGSFGRSSGKRISTKDRLLAFLQKDPHDPYWSVEDLNLWAELVKIRDVFKKGGRERIEAAAEDFLHQDREEFCQEIFNEVALRRALDRDPTWFKNSLLAAKRQLVEYPLTVFQKRGVKALVDSPKIIISTIHGAKGGEADIVFLFPDISLAALYEWQGNREGRDCIVRTFYVGMTRARETLIICDPYSNLSVKL